METKVSPMICKEIQDSVPRAIQGAMAARGYERLGMFLPFWAASLTHSMDKDLMSVHSAMELWNEAMRNGLWKGAALSLNLPTKVKALGPVSEIQAFLRDLGVFLQP